MVNATQLKKAHLNKYNLHSMNGRKIGKLYIIIPCLLFAMQLGLGFTEQYHDSEFSTCLAYAFLELTQNFELI